MKIAMLIDSWPPITGGGPTHVMELSKRLVLKHGCEVDVFTRAVKMDGQRYHGTEELLDGKLRIFRLEPCVDFWNPLGRLSYLFIPFFKIKDYDLIHAHAYAAGIPAYALQTFRKIPVVFTVHGSGLDCWDSLASGMRKGFLEYLEKIILLKLKYKQVISVNREFLAIAKRAHENISYVPNGVDAERFRGSEEKINDILFVGRFTPQKSPHALLEAMKLVQIQKPAVKVRLVGYGPLEKRLKELSVKLGLNNIGFTYAEGRDLIREYLSSRIFVLPSVYEGFPLTLLEAWSAGLPVIASNVSGSRELVRHKKNGMLVRPDDPEGLAQAILYTLNHPLEMEQWGRNGRELAEKFSWDEAARKTCEVYKKVVDRSPFTVKTEPFTQ